MSELENEPIPLAEEPRPDTPPTEPAPPPPVRSSGSSGRKFFWGALGGCLLVFILMTVLSAVVGLVGSRGGEGRWSVGAKVAIVPIEGEIVDARETINHLHHYARNDSVRALVVRINSPGGAIVPAQEIFEEIKKIRADGKPVIASMDSVAASGGYYIAAACDRIVANPGSITGSIGVILQWMNLEELLRWAKLKPETITTGRMKDAGSAYRSMSAEEKAYFERIIQQLHRQFIRAVADGRKGKLTEAQVTRLADGRIFTGEEAHQLKLVDELGNLDDAIALAGRLGGVAGRPRTVWPRREEPGLLELLGKLQTAEEAIQRMVSASQSPFAYRWSR
ncbi:MAG TPA: signal peptide peptidase SppA [Thermoanaerobaculia bacterium]